MACPKAWAAMKACFVFMSSPLIEWKKPRPCAEPQPPPSAACYPGEAAPAQGPRLSASRSPRPRPRPQAQAFNCVGVTPSSPAALPCAAPASDTRATDCSLYSSENHLLVCFVISCLQGGIQFTGWSAIREQRQTAHLHTQAQGSPSSRRDYNRGSTMERINSRLYQGFNFKPHYIRGRAKMKVRVGLALAVMMTLGQVRAGHAERMRSLVGVVPLRDTG